MEKPVELTKVSSAILTKKALVSILFLALYISQNTLN